MCECWYEPSMFFYVFTMAATYAASLGLFLMGIGLIMIAREISKR